MAFSSLGLFAGLIIPDTGAAFHRFILQNGPQAYIDVRLEGRPPPWREFYRIVTDSLLLFGAGR